MLSMRELGIQVLVQFLLIPHGHHHPILLGRLVELQTVFASIDSVKDTFAIMNAKGPIENDVFENGVELLVYEINSWAVPCRKKC